VEGVVFDVQRYAIHDGPGIRTNIYLKGCPLRCWWCQNPEGIEQKLQLMYFEFKCLHCHLCASLCPKKAIEIDENDVHTIKREICDGCGICSSQCPSSALKLVGRRISVEHLLEEIKRDTLLYDASGGGVTFTGGEPFFQPEFLKEVLMACKELDIHTAVETSGFVSREILSSLMKDIDLFLHDIKLIEDEEHRIYTGVSNRLILSNIRFLVDSGRRKDIIIRLPVIPTITDTDHNVNGIAEFLASLKLEEIHLLPFHDVKEKYERLGMPYKMTVHSAPSQERMKEIKERFEEIGMKVVLYG